MTRPQAYGLAVFPCHAVVDGECTCGKGSACTAPGKHPRTINGVKDATTGWDQIDRWSAQWPGAINWAAATGKISGIFVVDVDVSNGKQGEESLAAWEAEHGPLPDTFTVRSGGGGRHLYFRYPQVSAMRGRKLMKDVDLKADGGYVVLPGSSHISGGTYTVMTPAETRAAEAPQALLDAVSERSGSSTSAQVSDAASILQGVPEGARDTTLFHWACRLRTQHSTDEDGGRAVVTTLVLHAAANCVPPFPPEQALAKVEQAFRQPQHELTPEQLAWADAWGGQSGPTSRLNLLRASEVRDRPGPSYLVADVLPEGSLFQLFGQTGEFKSFVVVDLAGAVANGAPFMGHDVGQVGLVALILGEGGKDAGDRLNAWLEGHPGCTDDRILYSVEEGLDLMDDGEVDLIIEDLLKFQASEYPDDEWKLIVFDTQADHMPNGDEDKSRDFSQVKRSIQRIQHATGACVGLVHHTGWDKSRERGSSRQRQALDVVMQVENRRITNIKQKFGPKFADLHFETVETGPSIYVRPVEPLEPLQAVMKGIDADVRRMLEVIDEAGGQLSVNRIKRAVGCGHDRYKVLQQFAQDRGWIDSDNGLTTAGRDELRGE